MDPLCDAGRFPMRFAIGMRPEKAVPRVGRLDYRVVIRVSGRASRNRDARVSVSERGGAASGERSHVASQVA